MTDIADTILPKSDQLNADDLIAGPRVITITKVVKRKATAETPPVMIYFEDDNNKPYLPCLSMRRALVYLWGKDASKYVGRALKLYRDPTVKFGGVAVGGIRISHASDIRGAQEFPLTASKGSRKMFRVEPLTESRRAPSSFAGDARDGDGGDEAPPSPPSPDQFDDFPGDEIAPITPVPKEGAKPIAWQEWGQRVRSALEAAPNTARARAIARANREGIDAVPSAKLRAFILEPVGGTYE